MSLHPRLAPADPDALERAYSVRDAAPDIDEVVAELGQQSDAFRADADARLDLAYGAAGRERLDLFPAAPSGAPLLVYVHGGYWSGRDKSLFSVLARGFVEHGVSVALLNYSHCPHVTLDHIVHQCRCGLAWLWRNGHAQGVNAANLHLCGHSAGGHLAAMLATTDWAGFGPELPPELVKSVTCVSGLFLLEPLLQHSMNETLALDRAMARRNSPALLAPTLAGPLTVAWGSAESEAFQQQSLSLVEAWSERGADIVTRPLAELDHIRTARALLDPDSPLFTRQLEVLGAR